MADIFYKEKLESLLILTAQQNASDLHFSVGRKPTLRIDGRLVSIAKEEVYTKEVVEGLIDALVPEGRKEEFLKTERWTSLILYPTKHVFELMFIFKEAIWQQL